MTQTEGTPPARWTYRYGDSAYYVTDGDVVVKMTGSLADTNVVLAALNETEARYTQGFDAGMQQSATRDATNLAIVRQQRDELERETEALRERLRLAEAAATWRADLSDEKLDSRIADHEKSHGRNAQDYHDYRALVALQNVRRALTGAGAAPQEGE